MMWFFWFPFLVLVPIALIGLAHRGAVVHGCGMHHAHGAYTQAPQAPGANEAVEIVRLRLARGEITPAEYAEIRATLG